MMRSDRVIEMLDHRRINRVLMTERSFLSFIGKMLNRCFWRLQRRVHRKMTEIEEERFLRNAFPLLSAIGIEKAYCVIAQFIGQIVLRLFSG